MLSPNRIELHINIGIFILNHFFIESIILTTVPHKMLKITTKPQKIQKSENIYFINSIMLPH